MSFKNISSEVLDEKHPSSQLILVAIILLTAMFGLGLTFQITQATLPKLLDLRIDNITTYKIGVVVALIYGMSGLMSLIGGILADKFSLKKIYVIGLLGQVPCLFFIASLTGIPLIIVCLMAVLFNSSILPAENILLAKFTPEKHHGLIYGVKFIVAFGAGPIAIIFIAKVYEFTSEFSVLFFLSSLIMFLIAILALFLPVKNNN